MHKKLSEGLQKAIAAAGGIPALADGLGITPEAIYQWRVIPIRRVVQIEKLTGVKRAVLRPDFFA
jgi:DNA-binding transcriptional regulator YdaS (Cro superfamily)